MCFGLGTNQVKTTTYQPTAQEAAATNQALASAQHLQTAGFTPYSGQMVQPLNTIQNAGVQFGANMLNSGVPYVNQAADLIGGYGNAPQASVDPRTISTMMSPYMNQYVMQALAPQLEAQNQQFAAQNRGYDAASTGAGAFGNDAQAAIGRTNLTNMQDINREGLIGNAYNAAFNTAIGAGAQDVANNLSAQTTNANLYETALNRAMGAATGYQNLGTYGLGQGAQLASLSEQLGAIPQQNQQSALNAAYNQWLMGQQYPFQTQQLLNQTIQAGAQGTPAGNTQTTKAPNNSGLQLLGTLGGAALGTMLLPGIGTGIGAGLGGALGSSPYGNFVTTSGPPGVGMPTAV